MFNIKIYGPVNIVCDNEAVVTNISYIMKTQRKTHISIAYHKVR